MQPANDNNRTPHWPRGLSRLRAAAYIGVTPQAFDRMVAEEKMPPRTKIGGVWRWDKLAIDRHFDALFNTQTDLAGEEIIEFAA